MDKGAAVDEAAQDRKEAVGRLIRRKREKKGWTQTHLAVLTGISQPAISRMETGDVEPDHKDRVALQKHLGGRISDYRALA